MIEVVAAFIKNNDKILICQRPANKNCASMWEFAGGKVEKGEGKKDALIRECMEELGIKISVKKAVADTVYEYPHITIHITLFESEILSGEPINYEHTKIMWINKNDFDKYEFCPADMKLIKILSRDNE